MSEIDLAAIKARADAATPGPWNTSGPDTIAEWSVYSLLRGWMVASASVNDYPDSSFPKLRGGITGDEANRNAEFIAHARTDVPALLARIAELETERDAVAWHRDQAIAVGNVHRYESETAERRGYERAVARLRDMRSWAKWCADRIEADGWVQMIDLRQPTEAADYLDAVKESNDG